MQRITSKFWIYIYIFFLLFGPKIGGYLDTSAIVGIIVLLLHARKEHSIVISRKLMSLAGCILTLAIYEMIVGTVARNGLDITFIGRMLRSCIALISIYVFMDDFRYDGEEIVSKILVNVLLIHAIVILLTSTAFVSWQEILRPFTAYAAHVRQYRSTGLMAGFDMAGLLCVIGNTLVMSRKKFGLLECVQFCIFSVASFFTSRFTLILFGIIIVSFLITNRKNREKRLLKLLITLLLVFVVLFALTLLSATTSNMISFSFSIPRNLGWISTLATKVQVAYANSDIEVAFASNSQLPNSFGGMLFGTGIYSGGDVGYVRIINAVGVLGLVVIVMWHLCVIMNCYNGRFKSWSKNVYKNYMMIVFLAVLILLNFKNSYFFTGTFFEILLLVSFEVKNSREIEDDNILVTCE